MKTRIECLEELAKHAWYGERYKRLSEADLWEMKTFIAVNGQLDASEFDYAVNRMFLNKECKPQRATLMQEMLSAANTEYFQYYKRFATEEKILNEIQRGEHDDDKPGEE